MILIAFQLSVLVAGSLVDLQALGSLGIEGEDKRTLGKSTLMV